MMFQRVLLFVLFAFTCMLVTIEAAAQDEVQAQALSRVDYPVYLNPNPQPNERAIGAVVTNDKKCQDRPHDGCMLFTANTVGVINFYLLGARKKTKCSVSEGVKHVITKIELSTTPKVDDYSKGEFGKEVDAWLTESAFDNVNEFGAVYEANWDTGRTSVALTNWNRHVSAAGEPVKSFWYRVTVKECAEPHKETIFDPRGDNEGLH